MKTFYFRNIVVSILLVFFLSTAFDSFAQIEYGLKGGVTASSVKKKMDHSFSSSYDTRPKEGALFGAWIFIPKVCNNVGLQMELLYANKGSEYLTTYNTTSYTSYGGYSPYGYGYGDQPSNHWVLANESLHSLSLPVSFVFRSDKAFRYYLGAELSYLLKVNDEPTYGYSDYKRFSVGAIAGLQYQISEKVSTDLRYNFGITPYKKGYVTSDNEFRTRGFELSVSYKLGTVGKK